MLTYVPPMRILLLMTRARNLSAELRKAYKEAWPPTMAFFRWAEAVKTTPSETTIDELRAALAITKSDVKQLVDGIRELKLASFIVGRKGFPSRLRWLYRLPTIAATARGRASMPVAIANSIISERQAIKHSFRLRPDYVVDIELPEDLTPLEADRFAKFVLTLPFNGDQLSE